MLINVDIGSDTYEEQNSSAEEHKSFNRGLVERISHWIGMFVIAVLACPRCATYRALRATFANKLELFICQLC